MARVFRRAFAGGGGPALTALVSGTASGTFINCSGGNNSFGSGGGPDGTASGGRFYFCEAGNNSFTENGATAPIHLFCVENGAQYSGND